MESYKNNKILIADDMGFIRTSIRNILDELGFINIAEAKDGIQALAELKRSKYDLLICDYNMPNLDGISLVRMIKGDAELKDVMVLMVTAQAEKNQIINMQQLGISDYIVKPFTTETMEKKVIEILQK